MYSALYQQNQDNFNRVDKIYSEAYQNAMNIALRDYEMQREEKMQIGELMLKYPSAGIDMNGTLDEAFERAMSASGEAMNFDSEDVRRATQVLNGQASLSDFTVAEQAKIRDVVWSDLFSSPVSGFGASLDAKRYPDQTPGLMSYDPSQLQNNWDTFRLEVAGPGAGRIESSFNLDDTSFDNL